MDKKENRIDAAVDEIAESKWVKRLVVLVVIGIVLFFLSIGAVIGLEEMHLRGYF